MAAFVFGFRETLETALVIGLLLAILTRMSRRPLVQAAWIGIGAGVLLGVSIATGLLAGGVMPAVGAFQTVSMILSGIALVGLVVRLRSTRPDVEDAAGQWLTVAVASSAVLPQAVELVGQMAGASSVAQLSLAVVGMTGAALLAALLYFGTVRARLALPRGPQPGDVRPVEGAMSAVKQEVSQPTIQRRS